MILNEQQIKKIINSNNRTHDWIEEAREYSETLFALIEGRNFEELLERIEHIEGSNKSIARKKYARSIKDMFERLGRLIDNIYSANGGTKRYSELSNPQKQQLIDTVSNIRGGQSLQSWLEYNWKELYHLDPNGVIFLEYAEGLDPYPTYKSINSIRNYLPNGQNCEWLLFNPKDLEDGRKIWRLIDDVYDYSIVQKGEYLEIIEEATFAHEFGKVPAVINSNITKIGYEFTKLSPYDKVIEIAKEYGRDLSIKTIYKFLQGFPKHWRYSAPCPTCHGEGKDGETICGTCNGTGEPLKNDVTDEIRLTIPEADEVVLAPNIAGYISPDLETWSRFNEELQLLEDTIKLTHWGTIINTEGVATATEVVLDTQPATQRLNKYADVAQGVESMLTEMIANHLFIDKPKDEKVSSINYGRNYIIEALGTVLERYQASKLAGDNATILDRQYMEYLMVKYKSDPIGLKNAILKSNVEPYLHYTAEQITAMVGRDEAQKKILFDDFWKTIFNFDTQAESLKLQFDSWYEANKPQQEEETTTTVTSTPEGTTTSETTIN